MSDNVPDVNDAMSKLVERAYFEETVAALHGRFLALEGDTTELEAAVAEAEGEVAAIDEEIAKIRAGFVEYNGEAAAETWSRCLEDHPGNAEVVSDAVGFYEARGERARIFLDLRAPTCIIPGFD